MIIRASLLDSATQDDAECNDVYYTLLIPMQHVWITRGNRKLNGACAPEVETVSRWRCAYI